MERTTPKLPAIRLFADPKGGIVWIRPSHENGRKCRDASHRQLLRVGFARRHIHSERASYEATRPARR